MKILYINFETGPIKIILNDNDFIERWCELYNEYQKKIPNEHTYQITLKGFHPGQEFENLFNIIDQVNEHCPNTIPKDFTRAIGRKEFDIDDLSSIHYIYEKIAVDSNWLNGKFDKDTAIGVRDKLNDAIHHAESAAMGRAMSLPRVRFRIVDPTTGVPNTRKVKFLDSDYELFDPIVKPYTVYLNYNAVGEDFLKTYESKRNPETAVPLTEYSPSFFFVLQAGRIEKQQETVDKCRRWMAQHGFDSKNKYTSFGNIPLGTIHKERDDSYYKKLLFENIQYTEIKKL